MVGADYSPLGKDGDNYSKKKSNTQFNRTLTLYVLLEPLYIRDIYVPHANECLYLFLMFHDLPLDLVWKSIANTSGTKTITGSVLIPFPELPTVVTVITIVVDYRAFQGR